VQFRKSTLRNIFGMLIVPQSIKGDFKVQGKTAKHKIIVTNLLLPEVCSPRI